MITNPFQRSLPNHSPIRKRICLALMVMSMVWWPMACTKLFLADVQQDHAAEQILGQLRQTNANLTRFKCVGKITLTGRNQPTQSFRAAMAGQLADRLRIDMFSPFGGSAGTISSDGNFLYLVMPPSRDYIKKRAGSGSLKRLIRIDLSVNDLLELLMGRMPIKAGYTVQSEPTQNVALIDLVLIDRWGNTRQRITVDQSMRPVRFTCYDSNDHMIYSLTVSGRQVVDGFVLPERFDLSGSSGQRVSVSLFHYEANSHLSESLFTLTPQAS